MPGDGKVHMTMTANEAQAFTAIKKLSNAFTDMENKASKAGRKTKSTFKEGAKAAAGMAGAVVGITSATGLMILAFQQARRELDVIRERQAEAGRSRVSFTENVAEALRTAQTGTFTEKTILELINRLSEKTNIPKKTIAEGLIDPLSARGALSNKQFEDAITAALINQFRTGRPFGPVAGGIQDVLKTSPAGTTAQQALGFLGIAGQALRVTEQEKQIRTVAPLLGGRAKAAGATPEGLVELAATVSQQISDIQGRKSVSAALIFAENIRKELVPEKIQIGFGKTKTIFRRLQATTLQGRIDELTKILATASVETQQAIFEKLGGEVKTKGVFQDILLGRPGALKAFAFAKKQIPSPKSEETRLFQQTFGRQVEALPGADILKIAKTGETAAENLKLADESAFGGVTRVGLTKILQAAGVSDIGQKFALLRFELGSRLGSDKIGTAKAAIRAIAETQERFRFRDPTITTRVQTGRNIPGLGPLEIESANPEFNRAAADILDQQILIFADILHTLKNQKVEVTRDTTPTVPVDDGNTETSE